MPRDYALIRAILGYFHARPVSGHVYRLEIDGHNQQAVQYHLILMYEAGLLSCQPVYSDKGRLEDVLPFRMTWQGHELYAAIADPDTWRHLQAELAARGGDIPMQELIDGAARMRNRNQAR